MQISACNCYSTGAGTVFARVYPISFIGDGCRFRFVNRTSPQFVTEKPHNPDSIDAQYPDHIKTLLIQGIPFLWKSCLSICHKPYWMSFELGAWKLHPSVHWQEKLRAAHNNENTKQISSTMFVCLFVSYFRGHFTAYRARCNKKHEFSFVFWICSFIGFAIIGILTGKDEVVWLA